MALHKISKRSRDKRNGLILGYSVLNERRNAVLPGAFERRAHDKDGHEQRKTDNDEICRGALKPKAGSEKRKSYDKSRKARYREEYRGRNRQNCHQKDDLYHPT